MSAALAMPEPGGLRLVHPDPLGPVLDALVTPTPAVMRDARRWLDHLASLTHEAAVVALSPVTVPVSRAREVAAGRDSLTQLLDLWAAVDALPDASLTGLAASVPPRRYLAPMRLWTLALVAMVAACGSDDGDDLAAPVSGEGGAGAGGHRAAQVRVGYRRARAAWSPVAPARVAARAPRPSAPPACRWPASAPVPARAARCATRTGPDSARATVARRARAAVAAQPVGPPVRVARALPGRAVAAWR